MKTGRIYSFGYALLAGRRLTGGTCALAVDNNLHFFGNILCRACTLVVEGGNLAEVHFPAISRQDLMVAGESPRVPVVFKLKDCKGPASYQVQVTLTGTEDSEQPGFLALDTTSTAQGVGIGMETIDGVRVAINNPTGAKFTLSDGSNDIHFRAWLQAKSGRDVTLGDYTANLTVFFE